MATIVGFVPGLGMRIIVWRLRRKRRQRLARWWQRKEESIDPIGKTQPSLHFARKAEDANALVNDSKQRLTPESVPAFTTDGLRSHFCALTGHFGHWVKTAEDKSAQWQRKLSPDLSLFAVLH